jgi:ElaB/YqjD/DUF883 family membrane-anchored ribosome-binding protein
MNTKATEYGFDAAATAREAAQSVSEMARQAACTAGKKADEMTAQAGHSLKELGQKLGENAPSEGMLGTASQAFANSLRDGGEYLEETTLSGMAEEVTNLIKKNPLPAVLIGIGLGLMLGRLTRR